MKVGSATLPVHRLRPVLSTLAVVLCDTAAVKTLRRLNCEQTHLLERLMVCFFSNPQQSLEIRVDSGRGEINQALLAVAKHIRDLMLS